MNKFAFKLTAFSLTVISLLPFRLLFLIADLLYFILYYLVKYRRNVVTTNLQNAFPEKTPAEREEIARKFYVYLADMIMESIKSITISEDQFREHYKFEQLDEITKHLKNGRSVVAVSGHYGNWEWGALGVGLELADQTIIVYKPLSDKNFDRFTQSIRSRFAAVMIPMKQTLRKIAEYKDRPFLLVLLGDQTPSREDSHFFLPFLHQPTAVFQGVEKIAKKTNSAIVYFNTERLKRGYYTCHVKSLVEFPGNTDEQEITKVHLAELERIIKDKPEFWLWSHKRWKFKPTNLL